jgi:hypothetical protein
MPLRGERTAAQNERDFPHIVELQVPPNGFGVKLDAMYAFHRERNLRPTGDAASGATIKTMCVGVSRTGATRKILQKFFGGKST